MRGGRCAAALLLAAGLAGCQQPQIQDLRQFVAATKAASPGKKLDPLPEIKPYQPIYYTAQGYKDPFQPSAFVKPEPVAVDTGVRPDLDRPREELEKYALGSLKMVGTVERNGLWALIKAPDGIIHRVQVGNHLGADYGEITAITDQGIQLVEIIPNPAGSGWIERENVLALTE